MRRLIRNIEYRYLTTQAKKSPNQTASSFSKPLHLEKSLRKIVSFEQWSKYEQTTAPDQLA